MSKSPDITTNNNLIAKNTVLLYGRMLLMLLISLYTSRIILRTLGVIDYGIFNVVGGVIAMFAFLNSALGESTRRYLTFYLGKGTNRELQEVFSAAIVIHFSVALLVVLLAETIGLWFVLNKLVIPIERKDAALWVYQFSVVGAVIKIISSPYNATIIAHEKMGAFAYISLLEAALKLAMVFVLTVIPFDKLKFFAAFLFLIALIIRIIYGSYCGRHFNEAHFTMPHNRNLFKNMATLGGWSMVGILSGVLYWQGLSILLNMFFGPVVNAARGIALQVQSAMWQFATNFQNALNPQITKTYASNHLEEMHSLIIRSCKFSFLLLFILCLPISLETHYILSLWLGIVPDNTIIFINFTLAIMIVESMSNSLMIAVNATGKVKLYQTIVSGLQLSIVPFAYILLKMGGAPWTVFLVHFVIMVVALFARLIIVCPIVKMSPIKYIEEAIVPSIIVLITALPLPLILHILLGHTVFNAISVMIISVLCAGSTSYLFGLSQREKKFVINKIYILAKRGQS